MSLPARSLPLILVLTGLAGCSTSSPAGNQVAGTLVRPEQLTGQWQARDDRGTELAGGFCDLRPTVDSTAPVDQAVTVLVNGELLVRDTRLRYDGTAQQAYDTLRTRLADCRTDPDSARLRLTIEPLTVPSVAGGRSAGYRLRLPLAGTILLLDLALWQHGPVLGLTRLTHPQDRPETTEQLNELIEIAQKNSTAD